MTKVAAIKADSYDPHIVEQSNKEFMTCEVSSKSFQPLGADFLFEG